MPQAISVTEARDNFPALIRRIVEEDEPVVTSHSHLCIPLCQRIY